MSTDIDVYQGGSLAVPGERDMDSWIAVCSDVIKIANVINDTPFVPDGLRGSGPAVAAAILAGRELGIGPMTALQHIHVIKGKPAQSAALMRALIQAAGHKWEDGDVTDTRAVVRGCRRGESSWSEVTFTADQARRAGIDLGKYPQDKLYARATSRLARRKFADVIAGMPYSAEELDDGDGAPAGTVADAPSAANGQPPKTAQRTARRRQAPDPEPDPTAPAAGNRRNTASSTARAAESPSPTGGTEPAQPPLPGEDEPDGTDYDTPGTVTRDQLTAMWATFTADLGFTKDDRAEARAVCEKITGRKLLGGTTGNLSRNEASACIDTLKNVRTRERLIVLMNDGELPDAPPGDEPA